MTESEIWELFESKKSWAALTTIGPDGYPHTVSIGYFRVGDRLYCGCRGNTQKTRNIRQNPKVSLLVEAQKGDPPIRGAMFQGLGRVIDDPVELADVKRRKGDSESPAPGVAYIEIEVQRIRSWTRC